MKIFIFFDEFLFVLFFRGIMAPMLSILYLRIIYGALLIENNAFVTCMNEVLHGFG